MAADEEVTPEEIKNADKEPKIEDAEPIKE